MKEVKLGFALGYDAVTVEPALDQDQLSVILALEGCSTVAGSRHGAQRIAKSSGSKQFRVINLVDETPVCAGIVECACDICEVVAHLVAQHYEYTEIIFHTSV